MAQRANLIATYNSNPTLQSRYTLQEYLDLFGFGATTTPTPDPDPTPTPTPEVPGIPNIINQNINQGGGGDGGPQGIATIPGTYQKEVIGVMPDGSPMFSGYKKTEGPGIIDSLKNTANAINKLPDLPEMMEKANQALTFLASGGIPQSSNSYSAFKDKQLELKTFRNQTIIGIIALVFLSILVF